MSTERQVVLALRDDRVERLELPAPTERLMPGVTWGRFDEFFTPAFWVSRSWIDGPESYAQYTLGRSLAEELAACMLGGYGMPAEMGLAAHRRLVDRGLLTGKPTASELESALAEPLEIGGRHMRYRFPRAKSRFLSAALDRLTREAEPSDDLGFRDWLMTFDGVGPKTASWITRNYRHSDEVAIIDIHIQRAGRLAGVFGSGDKVERDYLAMENRLVQFSRAIEIRLSLLDNMIWNYMKRLTRVMLPSIQAA